MLQYDVRVVSHLEVIHRYVDHEGATYKAYAPTCSCTELWRLSEGGGIVLWYRADG
jgi:hypothetical protein